MAVKDARSEHDISTSPAFGTQIIGQTEKTLNAILDRQLAGTGLSEPQWVTLTIAVMSGGTIYRASFTSRVASALKISDAQAQARITELADAGLLLDMPGSESPEVRVTDAGRQLHGRIRAAIAEITERLWGDLPAEDLATAGRVLSTVLARANAELAQPQQTRQLATRTVTFNEAQPIGKTTDGEACLPISRSLPSVLAAVCVPAMALRPESCGVIPGRIGRRKIPVSHVSSSYGQNLARAAVGPVVPAVNRAGVFDVDRAYGNSRT